MPERGAVSATAWARSIVLPFQLSGRPTTSSHLFVSCTWSDRSAKPRPEGPRPVTQIACGPDLITQAARGPRPGQVVLQVPPAESAHHTHGAARVLRRPFEQVAHRHRGRLLGRRLDSLGAEVLPEGDLGGRIRGPGRVALQDPGHFDFLASPFAGERSDHGLDLRLRHCLELAPSSVSFSPRPSGRSSATPRTRTARPA